MTTADPDTSADTEAPADASALATVLLRDVALATTLLSVWAGAEAWAQQSGLAFGTALSSVGGLLVGAAATALVHEWGHFLGARLSGGVAPIAPARNLLPLFQFDFARSHDGHFRAMSVGGNVAHWLAALALLIALPGTTPGTLAVQCGAIGFATFASTIEFPVIRRAFAGEPGTTALASIRPETLQRAGWVGFGTALGLFVLL